MNFKNNDFSGDPKVLAAVGRYEKMVETGKSFFFDISELEGIIDYYIDQLNISKACKATDFAITQYPKAHTIQLRRAQLLIEKTNFNKAFEILDSILAENKMESEAYLLKGIVYLNLEKFNKAIVQLENAIEFSSKDYVIYYSVGMALCTTPKYLDQGLIYFRLAYEMADLEDEQFLYDYAAFLLQNHKYEASLPLFEKVIKLNQFNKHAWYYKGTIYQTFDNYVDAINCYDLAIVIDENFTKPYFSLADCYYNMNEYTKAIDIYFNFLTVVPNNWLALYSIGECFERLEYNEDAIYYYKKSIEQNSNNSDAYYGIGLIHLNQGNLKESLVSLENALTCNWEDEEIWYAYARVNQQLNHIDGALLAFQRVYELAPRNEEYLFSYVQFLISINLKDDAFAIIQDELAKNAKSADFLEVLNSNFELDYKNTLAVQKCPIVAMQSFLSSANLEFLCHKELISTKPEDIRYRYYDN